MTFLSDNPVEFLKTERHLFYIERYYFAYCIQKVTFENNRLILNRKFWIIPPRRLSDWQKRRNFDYLQLAG